MKKILATGLLMALFLTGCTTTEESITLEDYYLELMNKKDKDISMKEVKKDLKNFEYGYTFNDMSDEVPEDEIEKYEEMGMTDTSDNVFIDKEGRSLDIGIDETNKIISTIIYRDESDDFKIESIYSAGLSSVMLYGSDIDKQRDIIDKLNLSENSYNILHSYYEVVQNLYDKKEMTISDVENILDLEDYNYGAETYSEDRMTYSFYIENMDIRIEAYTSDEKVTDIEIDFNFKDKANYSIRLDATNNEIISNDFNLETRISPNLSIDEDLWEDRDALEPINKESLLKLLNFVLKDKELEFYSSDYSEEDEKETSLLTIKYDKAKDVDSIHFQSKKAPSEDGRPYDVDKTFRVKLKKGEKVKVHIETKEGQVVEEPINIYLYKAITYDTIYEKSIGDLSDNVVVTDKVEEDGDYQISVDMKDIESYRLTISAISE